MINIDSRLIEPGSPDRLDADEIYLLMHLTKRINQGNTCWPSIPLLMKECGWSEDKLKQVRRRLLQKRVIEEIRKGGGRKSTIYRINCEGIGVYLGGGKKTPPVNLPTSEGGKTVAPEGGILPTSEGVEKHPEVLVTEVSNIEALEREKAYLSFCIQSVFDCLIENVFTQFQDYKHSMAGYKEIRDIEEIKDITIRKSLEKILEAARAIYSAMVELKRPFPEWRETSNVFGTSVGESDPRREAIDQIESYADFCRISGTHMTAVPEKLPEKIISADWCHKLLQYAEAEIQKGRYDPAHDEELQSQWLIEQYYFQVIDVYVCKRQENRIVYAGEEYRKVNSVDLLAARLRDQHLKKYPNPGKIQ